jgi:hypothetical protein
LYIKEIYKLGPWLKIYSMVPEQQLAAAIRHGYEIINYISPTMPSQSLNIFFITNIIN